MSKINIKKNENLTRTIWVSCLSHFLLLLLHSRQICNGCCTRTSRRSLKARSGQAAHLPAIIILHLDRFLAPRQFVPRLPTTLRSAGTRLRQCPPPTLYPG